VLIKVVPAKEEELEGYKLSREAMEAAADQVRNGSC